MLFVVEFLEFCFVCYYYKDLENFLVKMDSFDYEMFVYETLFNILGNGSCEVWEREF